MEVELKDLIGWLFQGGLTLIGGLCVKSLGKMRESIETLNVQVGQLITHKESSEKRFDKIEERVHDLEIK